MTSIINPRLIDSFDLTFTQDDVDFAIPHLKEDIPLYLDPFLLWSSDNPIYQQLHSKLVGFFEQLRSLISAGRELDALRMLLTCEEPRELGLGYALGSKRGSTIGPKMGRYILVMYQQIPQIADTGLNHIEALQLVVPGIAEDRISDITASVLKDFFLTFTQERALQYNIPIKRFIIPNVYDGDAKAWRPRVEATLPYNPSVT